MLASDVQRGGADRYWVNHGYAVVNTDVRGTGASFGRWPAPWSRDEVRDMGDVVKWIVAQAWSNGKVVTIGTSYTANTAELTSVSNHPAVKAVIPRFSDFDLYKQLAMPGGLFNDFMAREWGNAVAAMDRNEKRGNPPIGVRPVDDDKDRKLLEAAVRDHQQNPGVYEASKEITFRDDRPKGWNASMDDLSAFSFRKEFERSKVPIYGWASWLDAGTAEGALARFMTFNNPQRLVIGPWSHGAGYHASPFLPPNTPTDPSRDAQMKEAVCFVYLEDVDESGRVTYITEGLLRAIHRKISSDPRPYRLPIPYHSFKRKDAQPLVVGQTAEITFGLYPTSVLIKKGHRIRVAIAGADKDTFVRTPAEGTPVITVARNKRHESFIDLPVVNRE